MYKLNAGSYRRVLYFLIVTGLLCSIADTIFSEQRWSGALTFNYRAIGQRPKEVEIEDQMLISDFYLRLVDWSIQDIPFLLEFSSDLEGKLELYRVNFNYLRLNDFGFTLGKFLIPFGLYNKLYRPDMYFTLTKPLLYATPGLDYVSGINFPHPPFSSGYTDVGLSVNFDGRNVFDNVFIPNNIDLYVVNGLQERGREPLRPQSFIIFKPVEGIDLDWGHERNFLADNNDTKSIGGRISYDFGDLSLLVPTYPLPQRIDLKGVTFGFSGTGGKYDIEDRLTYAVFGADLAVQLGDFNVSSEYSYAVTEFKARDYNMFLTTTTTTINLIKDRYITRGAYLQVVFPFPRFPLSKKTNLISRIGRISRDGPELVVENLPDDNEVGFITPNGPQISSRIYKYTMAFNSWMSEHFTLKLDFSYWDFRTSEDIYQFGAGGVLSF